VWFIGYNVISIVIGVVATRLLKLPSWTAPALAFNNTTSLPLLLIQSLDATGILDSILRDGDSTSDAVSRAQSYFLINAMVSNSLTFALGPRLLKPGDEDAPDGDDEHNDGDDADGENRQADGEIIDEETSLLPHHHVIMFNRASKKGYQHGKERWANLPSWAQTTLDFIFQFANAPLIGAAVGAVIGLTPPLHKLFFSQFNDGGYLNAWLTTSIKNIGDLFASLQIIVVGVKLSKSLRLMKRGEESGPFSWTAFLFITFVRFIMWPLYVLQSAHATYADPL
jgi:predicted permease